MHGGVLRRGIIVLMLVVAVGVSWLGTSRAAPTGKLEIFSWWTAGGEADDQVHGPVRIGLRGREAAREREGDERE